MAKISITRPRRRGGDGRDGYDGWTPEIANIQYGERIVQQVTDWIGGSGTKPPTGIYIGEDGFVDDISEATDIRGKQGLQGIKGERGEGFDPVDVERITELENTTDVLSENITEARNIADLAAIKAATAGERAELGISNAAEAKARANEAYALAEQSGNINYSLEEQIIGTWIDGTPLYQKTIEFGVLPKQDFKSVNHNISNLKNVVSLHGTSYNPTNNYTIMFPHISSDYLTSQTLTAITNTEIRIKIPMNFIQIPYWTNEAVSPDLFTETYITLQYTKTN